ncbi:MAG: ABC transporter ATP-binding protein [Sulfuricella denitrificans]|nr:ABC transporter ATP-binding protein [Sulfuricella denitrificans]
MLEVHDLNVSYGGIKAVRGISLEIAAGELVCLIGANGAGKSTTLKALARLLPASGKILYQGRSIVQMPVYDLVRQGIALVPEGRGIFGRLKVEENLLMGAYSRSDIHGIRRDLDHSYHLFPRLFERKTQQAGTLSGGEQQMLAIARALMSRPRLLLLDEPSMGLAPLMVNKIFDTIRAISADGVTILLVEQNARLALDVSHRAYVMEGGTICLSGEASTLLDDPQVRHAYLGE